tara:strand:- start:182 stop:1006 length:825 start_codon:yes stop_codon:yes gene_type:complete
MTAIVKELQGKSSKSIIELYSLELKAGVHYTKVAKTATYTQSGNVITIALTSHGFSVGLILTLNFTSGGAADGIYTIQTVSTNSFTVTATVSASITGTNNVSFNVNATITNPTVYLFHSGNNIKNNSHLVWQANTYEKFPINAEGYAYTGQGKLPRPTLTMSNLFSTLTTLMLQVNQTTPFSDLTGAKLTRRRTLARFLDEVNFPSNINPYKVTSVDPSAEMPREIYYIERKIVENRDVVQFELVSTFDLIGIFAPKKLVTRADFPLVGTFTNA